MRIDLNKDDFLLIDNALVQYAGKSKQQKLEAETLRLRLRALTLPAAQPPLAGTHFTPIRSPWPSGDVVRETKPNGYFDTDEARRVRLNNSTRPKAAKPLLTVEDVLAGLL